MMISTVRLFKAADFAVGPTLAKETASGASSAAFEGRPHHARGVAGWIADLAARKLLRAVHAIALQPVKGLTGIGIDAHQRDRVGALAARHQHGREIGNPERRVARSHLERGDTGPLADLDTQID